MDEQFDTEILDELPRGYTSIEYTLHVLKTREGVVKRPSCIRSTSWTSNLSVLRKRGYNILSVRGGRSGGGAMLVTGDG